MDANTLRVYDEINHLGITEGEYDTITAELAHREYAGTVIVKVCKDCMVTINHDQKHNIEIVPKHENIAGPGRVLFKTFCTFDIPKEIYVLHEIAQYRCDDNIAKYHAKDLEELKDSIMERICGKEYVELGYIRQERSYDSVKTAKIEVQRKALLEEQLAAVYWLFGTVVDSVCKGARANIPMIVKVFQRKNRRLAIIQYDKDYDEQHGGGMYGGGKWTEHIEKREYRINIYKPSMPQYNYASEGRELLWDYHNNEVWIDDDLLGKIPSEELKLINGRGENNFTLLNAKDYGRIQKTIRIQMMEESRKGKTDDAERKLRERIDKEFTKGRIVRHGITFTHNTIEYNGIILRAEKVKEYVISQRIHLSAEPEFTSIFEGYVDWLLKLSNYKSRSEEGQSYYSEFRGDPQSITIRGVKVVILEEHNFLFVNNRKVSKYDIAVVVKNAINYDTQESYDAYVVTVSQTNLKVQQALAEGYIAFDISLDSGHNDNCLLKTSTSIRMSIPILREKNKNYTIINGVKYPISNTEAIFEIDAKPQTYYKDGELNRAIKHLYKGIKGITPKVIGELIHSGETLYKEHYAKIRAEHDAKIARSKAFLAHAIKLTSAQKIKGGYKVKGISGTVYTVNAETLAVYKGGDYLCIVDTGDYTIDADPEALKNDRIAKRLLALNKDSVVAKEIYDKGDRQDKWWIEVEG